MRLSTLSALALTALAASFSSASALPVRAGILQCQGGQHVGFVVGSVASLECVFQSEGRRPEPYIATIHRLGLDLGVTQLTRLSWAVNAPTNRVGRGDLSGNYGGVGANASVGVGGGGNFLVGGPANSYALQPISVQGQTGLNVAAGIADLELTPVAFGRGGHPPPPSPSPPPSLSDFAMSTKRPAKAGLFFIVIPGRAASRGPGIQFALCSGFRVRTIGWRKAPTRWRAPEWRGSESGETTHGVA